MKSDPEETTGRPEAGCELYDVLIIGAGPAGCEAALSAAGAGARTLCLTINLDTVGYPPASPELISGSDDRRVDLFQEFVTLGGRLPMALERDGVTVERKPGGRLLVDRRHLGLAYKEMLECAAPGLDLRQALVTSLEASDNGWNAVTRLGERFHAAAVVVAAGTFLFGMVEDGGVVTPGGRIGEIPSNSLAKCLQNMGIGLARVYGTTMPRVDDRSLDSVGQNNDTSANDSEHRIIPDGEELAECQAYDYRTPGNRLAQLKALREETGSAAIWITRASFTVRHSVLKAHQVDTGLRSHAYDRLFFTGRAAGSCNYLEAATLGLLAGRNAAARAMGTAAADLTKDTTLVKELCLRIATREDRPVTVRIEEPGC